MPVTTTTTFPGVQAPDLGNGVEDEISVGTDNALNNDISGQYRIQARETGESAWASSAVGWAEIIAAAPTAEEVVTGREDGEEYEVRLRYETDYGTSNWSAVPSIITLFPGSAALSAVGIGQTEVSLEWTDHADNEDGQRVIRERRGKDGNWWPEAVLEDVGPNTESYTDPDVTPGNEYRYQIEAFTEHTDARSSPLAVTTDSYAGAQDRRIPPSGPYVEIEADDGTVRKPSPIEINPNPTLNGFPRIEISVPRDESWQDDRWDEATLRVWRDGERLPIDQLERPKVTPSETVLYGLGGSALDSYVEREFSFTTVHEAVDTLLSEETSLPYEIDDPGGETDLTEIDYAAGASGPDLPLPFDGYLLNDATEPIYVADDGSVQLAQTTRYYGGEQASGGDEIRYASYYADPPDYSADGAYSSPAANQITTTGIERTVEVDHEIPSEHVAIEIRWHLVDAAGEARVAIDNQIVGARNYNGWDENLEWVDFVGESGFTVPGDDTRNTPDDPPTLEPGTYEIEIDVQSYSSDVESVARSGDWNIDAVAVYDDRYPPTLPNSTDSNNVLPVSETFPASVTARFPASEPFGAVESAILETTWANGDVSGGQSVALSNDRGATWTEQSNTASLDVTFDEFGPNIEFRTTISAIADSDGNSQAATQALEAATVAVDTSGSPLIEGKTYRDSLMEVLKSMASLGDVLFEIQTLDSGGVGLVMAYPGQRSADISPELIDYSVEKKPMEQVNELQILGRTHTVTAEPFSAESYGAPVPLEQGSLKAESEVVRDPETGETFERGPNADYDINYTVGEIELAVGGQSNMDTGKTYEINYSWQPDALVSRPNEDGEIIRTRSRPIPGLYSEQECKEAAHFLLRELEQMPWEASIEISDAVGWQLLAAVDPNELPGSGPYRVRSLDETSESVTAELGRGSTVGEAVDELRGRLSSTEREV